MRQCWFRAEHTIPQHKGKLPGMSPVWGTRWDLLLQSAPSIHRLTEFNLHLLGVRESESVPSPELASIDVQDSLDVKKAWSYFALSREKVASENFFTFEVKAKHIQSSNGPICIHRTKLNNFTVSKLKLNDPYQFCHNNNTTSPLPCNHHTIGG